MDRARFSQLVACEQESLRRLLLALCLGNQPLADDLAQETLVKAWLSCANYKDEGRFTAWIYRIAYHTFIDHQRSLHPTAPLSTAREVPADGATDAAFRYEALYAALALLPQRERTALLLFYLKGYSAREISGIMECSEDAVKKHLQRGREHMRTTMDKDGTGRQTKGDI